MQSKLRQHGAVKGLQRAPCIRRTEARHEPAVAQQEVRPLTKRLVVTPRDEAARAVETVSRERERVELCDNSGERL
eukprot:5166011-Prymnesium_polylepis.1